MDDPTGTEPGDAGDLAAAYADYACYRVFADWKEKTDDSPED